MDAHRFDRLATRLAATPTRRSALRLLAGGALAALLPARLGARAAAQEAQAVCRFVGEPCTVNGHCCHGNRCRGGTCQCRPNLTSCGGRCRDLRTNERHCGACDHRCEAGQTCCRGRCVACCTDADCAPPQTCGGGGTPGVCGCTPRACEPFACGSFDDGCGGTHLCGGCATGEICLAQSCRACSATTARSTCSGVSPLLCGTNRYGLPCFCTLDVNGQPFCRGLGLPGPESACTTNAECPGKGAGAGGRCVPDMFGCGTVAFCAEACPGPMA